MVFSLLFTDSSGAQDAGAPPPGPAPALAASPLARQLNDSFAGVFEKVAPAVVVIESTRSSEVPVAGLPKGLEFFLRRPDGREIDPNIGSGFIIRSDGYILTNHHVVEDATEITVKLHDGRRFPATVVGNDPRTDLAVLKLEATGLPVADLGDSDKVRVGQFAFAIGTPLELPYTFTVGVLSAKDRSLGGVYGELLQTDASINPGNSGGPLCDIDGQVVGVNTLISGMNRGLGFAIPINVAKNVAQQLIAEGRVRRPWLGISIAGVEENVQLRRLFPSVNRGVVVQGIEPNAPAQSSDLRPGDVILRVDGVEVGLAGELQRQILSKQIGQNVELEVWRQGQNVKVGVRTGEQPDFQQASIRPRRESGTVRPPSEGSVPTPSSPGMSFRDATPEALQEMGLPSRSASGGVLVTAVEESSAAAGAGLEVGDIITDAGGRPVNSSKELEQELKSPSPGSGLLLLIERKGTRTFAILKP